MNYNSETQGGSDLETQGGENQGQLQIKANFDLTLCLPDVLYVDNLEGFPAKFRAGGL